MKIAFTKMCASGNDFVVIDNRDGGFDPRNEALVRRLCTRRLSVGADGLILLEPDDRYAFSMRYFNRDGREASMCGNGGRCISLFAHHLGISSTEMTFSSPSGVYSAKLESIQGEQAVVALSMPEPSEIRPNESLQLGGESVSYGSIDTGVPHVIRKVDDLDALDIVEEGRRIRNHPRFQEKGTNVDFIEIRGDNRIRIRTYERGVEGETLSCGTGSTASALMVSIWTGMKGPIQVGTASGEDLAVSFEREGERFRHVTLKGEARIIYRGETSEV